MTNPTVRLLICDDHVVVRAGLRALRESPSATTHPGHAPPGAGALVVYSVPLTRAGSRPSSAA